MRKYKKLITFFNIYFIFIGLSVICITSCKTFKLKNSFAFFYKVPIVQLDGRMQNISDSFYIGIYGDVIIYKMPINQTIEDLDSLKILEKKYRYFMYNCKEKFGYLFANNSTSSKRVSVDSFLNVSAFGGVNFFDNQNDLLSGIYNDMQPYRYYEKYVPKLKEDNTYPDTTVLFYTSELEGLPFSFSKELERKSGLKIGKVKLIYNEYLDSSHNTRVPFREFEFKVVKGGNFNDSIFYALTSSNIHLLDK